MRTLGWIFTIFGCISCIGAASAGNNIFGPCVFIALGIFLINKSKDSTSKDSVSVSTSSSNTPSKSSPKSETAKPQSRISLKDINASLTLSQRESAMCLIAFFGGFNNDYRNDLLIRKISENAATFFGFNFNPEEMAFVLKKHSDIDSILDSIKTIKQKNAIEFLILSCHDLCKISNYPQAQDLLKMIVAKIGYDETSFNRLVLSYSKNQIF